jgi:predicted ATPase/class 3 adenylate cyclase
MRDPLYVAVPSGVVSFLLTDVEGSAGRWERDEAEMNDALAEHDAVVRSAIAHHGGYVFSTAGDSFAAAFTTPLLAVSAAVDAQRGLADVDLRVRMAVHVGETHEREGDYFGPTVNRAARLMAAGHGGQVLVSNAAAELLDGRVELRDLGEHRLRDLTSTMRVWQVAAPGLDARFPPLRTLEGVPGNLPVAATRFIGRDMELKKLAELVRDHRLVTLTGVGGVGKTRLAIQVAAELVMDFDDGVWLAELASVADPDAVPDVVAAALGVRPQTGSVTESITTALTGRSLLLVVDNCEHVLDAVAQLIGNLLTGTSSVTILATSREALGLAPEQRWPVPPFAMDGGARSPAVELFTERAQALNPDFQIADGDDAATVVEICRRLDGIALAIELAAARMVSMTPRDLFERLDDRFRVLSGSPRVGGRHHTLVQSVQWSYELLDEGERRMLDRCSVFFDGFDLRAATQLSDGLDEYTVFDQLDSLVRKSLITVDRHGAHARYRMLETIRQYADDRLAADGDGDDVRDRHAAFFAWEVQRQWERWDSPDQDSAIEWLVTEFANLRAGFRWASDRGHIVTATAIAAHAAMLAREQQRLEPFGWAVDALESARAAGVAQLPRLFTAASLCAYLGRPDEGVEYAQAACRLEATGVHDPFEAGWSGFYEGVGHLYAGRLERAVTVMTDVTFHSPSHPTALGGLVYLLSAVNRSGEALVIADENLELTRARGNPVAIAFALLAYGRALEVSDPDRALTLLREAHELSRAHPIPIIESLVARDRAGLETRQGEIDQALDLLDETLTSFHRAGHVANVAGTIANLAVLFDRLEQPEIAATLAAVAMNNRLGAVIVDLPHLVERLRSKLGDTATDDAIAAGAKLDLADGMRYAHQQIAIAQRERAEAADAT